MTRSMTLSLATLLISLSWSALAGAHAQSLPPSRARQFAELAERGLFGEEVAVTSFEGVVLKGTIIDVDAVREVLGLRSGAIDFRLPAAGIRTIERRVRDPLSNGAWIGAAAGLGAALVYGAGASGSGGATAAAVFTVPIGTVIGAGIDLAFDAPETIYRAPPELAFPDNDGRQAFSVRIVW